MRVVKQILDEIEKKLNLSGNKLAEKLGITSGRYSYYKQLAPNKSGERLKGHLRFIIRLWEESGMKAEDFLKKIKKGL